MNLNLNLASINSYKKVSLSKFLQIINYYLNFNSKVLVVYNINCPLLKIFKIYKPPVASSKKRWRTIKIQSGHCPHHVGVAVDIFNGVLFSRLCELKNRWKKVLDLKNPKWWRRKCLHPLYERGDRRYKDESGVYISTAGGGLYGAVKPPFAKAKRFDDPPPPKDPQIVIENASENVCH